MRGMEIRAQASRMCKLCGCMSVGQWSLRLATQYGNQDLLRASRSVLVSKEKSQEVVTVPGAVEVGAVVGVVGAHFDTCKNALDLRGNIFWTARLCEI